MKITKNMLDKELQSYFTPLKLFSFLAGRVWGIKFLDFVGGFSKGKNIKGLVCEEHFVPSKNGGPDIRVRVFKPLDDRHKQPDEKLPAMLYNHGGGYVMGSPEISLDIIQKFIETRPCVVIAPAYRTALQAPFPAGFNDCYDTLLWAKENADSLGIQDKNFIIAGHSAGGGMTAALTLKARDTQEVDIAFQMPIYPMIDDRQTSESAKNIDVPVWNTKTNALAWSLYLNGLNDVRPYAAPARNENYKDFPPTITFVGDCEPFRDETITYVDALKTEGVDVTFKLYKGCFHAFDILGAKANIAQEAVKFTYQSYADYYDKYIS